MSYGWMKFIYLELHPLIVHTSWPQWGCVICFWNALRVAHDMVQLSFAFEGAFNVSTSNFDFYCWLFKSFSLECSCRIRKTSRISEGYGTRYSDTLWMSNGWMKFEYCRLHPLIVHASEVGWGSTICFQNALWVAYNMVQIIFCVWGRIQCVDFKCCLFKLIFKKIFTGL
jgi:hypothetical protein